MYKKKYQKYLDKIGGFVNSSCKQIKDEEIENNIYNYVFTTEEECQDFNKVLNKIGLNKFTMNKEEELEKLSVNSLLKLAEYEDFWKLYLKNTTPEYEFFKIIHFAIIKFTSKKYLSFWKKMAKYPDLWKLQISYTNIFGENSEGISALHLATYYLKSEDYISFWIEMTKEEYADLWFLQSITSDPEQTPLYYAIQIFTSPIYLSFFEKLRNIINVNKINYSSFPYIIKKDIFKIFFGEYYEKQYNTNFYIYAHGALSGNFFKLPKNITIIFIAKSFTQTFNSKSSQYISSLQNDINTTLNMCDKINVLRKYNPNDLIPNVLFQFYDNNPIYFIRGIFSNPNILLKDYLQVKEDVTYENPIFAEKRDMIDDLGIFEYEQNKKNIISNLYDIVNYVSNKYKNENITIVVGSCRDSLDYNLNYERLCKYIKLIDRPLIKKTRYDNLCFSDNELNIISKNKSKYEIDLNLKLQNSFASPENLDNDISNSFEDDITYALALKTNQNIENIKNKLLNNEQITFDDIIYVYKHIINTQEILNIPTLKNKKRFVNKRKEEEKPKKKFKVKKNF